MYKCRYQIVILTTRERHILYENFEWIYIHIYIFVPGFVGDLQLLLAHRPRSWAVHWPHALSQSEVDFCQKQIKVVLYIKPCLSLKYQFGNGFLSSNCHYRIIIHPCYLRCYPTWEYIITGKEDGYNLWQVVQLKLIAPAFCHNQTFPENCA